MKLHLQCKVKITKNYKNMKKGASNVACDKSRNGGDQGNSEAK